jgi:cytochrome b561
MTKLHRATVKVSEYGLYALLLGQPVTGLLSTLFGGRPFALFLWEFPPLMPRDEMLRAAFHLSHEIGAWALAALAVSHAAAALFHHFVLRDDVLECMAPVIQRYVLSRSSQPAHRSGPKRIRGIKAIHWRSCW